MIELTVGEANHILTILEGIQELIKSGYSDDIVTLDDDIEQALEILRYPKENESDWESEV